MKKTELKFKVAALTFDRRDKILVALKERKFKVLDDEDNNTFIFVSNGTVALAKLAMTFTASEEPEVTYLQALDLIAQVEPNPEQGLVEFAVGDDGIFCATWKNGESHRYFYWSNVASAECESDMELVFAGWLWKDGVVSVVRRGSAADDTLNSLAGGWTKPAQPTHVRFWRNSK